MSGNIRDTVNILQVEQATMKANAKEQSIRVEDLNKKIDKLDEKLDTVIAQLNSFSGGRATLLWLAGIAGSIGIVFATYFGIHHK